jgi:hypothetical protein
MNPPITLRRSAAFFLLLVSLGLLLSDLRTPVATARDKSRSSLLIAGS